MKRKLMMLMLAFVMIFTACANGNSKTTKNDKTEKTSKVEKVESNNDKKVKIVASFFPIADLSEKIGGDKVEVKNLVKNGSAHGFEPSVGDMKDIVGADVVIINGAGFESWVEKVKQSNPNLPILDLSEGLDLIKNDGDHDHDHDDAKVEKDHDHDHDHDHDDAKVEKDHDHDHDHDHEDAKVEKDHNHDHDHDDAEHSHNHGPNDPHIWMSLDNLEKMSEKIYKKLSEIDSSNEKFYKQNLDKVEKKIDELENKYKNKFEKHKGKSIIVPHEAFAYLVKELEINQIGLEGINSDSEPTITKIAEVSEIMKKKNISTVFYDYGKSDKAAQTIAKETGAKVKPISTLEVITDEEVQKGNDLFKLVEMNLKNILDSFEGK